MPLIYNKFRNLQITFLGKYKKIFNMQLFLSPKVAIRILLGTHNSNCLCFVMYMGTKNVQTKHITCIMFSYFHYLKLLTITDKKYSFLP